MRKIPKNIYEITHCTKSFITRDTTYAKTGILDGHKELDVQSKPEDMENTCLMHHSSMNGRRKSAKNGLNISAKVPIAVIPNKGGYILPAASAKSKDCAWISYSHA